MKKNIESQMKRLKEEAMDVGSMHQGTIVVTLEVAMEVAEAIYLDGLNDGMDFTPAQIRRHNAARRKQNTESV